MLRTGVKMKVQPVNTEVFKPYSIQITFESDEEENMVYALFCHSFLINAIGGKSEKIADQIRAGIRISSGYTPDYHNVFDKIDKVVSRPK